MAISIVVIQAFIERLDDRLGIPTPQAYPAHLAFKRDQEDHHCWLNGW